MATLESWSVQFTLCLLTKGNVYGACLDLDAKGNVVVCSPKLLPSFTNNLLPNSFLVFSFSWKNLIADSILLFANSTLYDGVAGAEQLASIVIVTIP
jgi:hypothetical protein